MVDNSLRRSDNNEFAASTLFYFLCNLRHLFECIVRVVQVAGLFHLARALKVTSNTAYNRSCFFTPQEDALRTLRLVRTKLQVVAS